MHSNVCVDDVGAVDQILIHHPRCTQAMFRELQPRKEQQVEASEREAATDARYHIIGLYRPRAGLVAHQAVAPGRPGADGVHLPGPHVGREAIDDGEEGDGEKDAPHGGLVGEDRAAAAAAARGFLLPVRRGRSGRRSADLSART